MKDELKVDPEMQKRWDKHFAKFEREKQEKIATENKNGFGNPLYFNSEDLPYILENPEFAKINKNLEEIAKAINLLTDAVLMSDCCTKKDLENFTKNRGE